MRKVCGWRHLGVGALLLLAGFLGGVSHASLYEGEWGDHALRVDGRFRQSMVWGYHKGSSSPGGQFQNQSDEYQANLITNYDYQHWFRFKLDLQVWGDFIHALRHDHFGYTYQGKFHRYGRSARDKLLLVDTCQNSGECSNFFRDSLLREASLTLTDKEVGYTITLGKFQRGWGQADGLRLMDVINPLDFRKRFIWRDFDELRIEQWMVDAIFYLDRYIPLQRFGIDNQNLELIWIPNVRHSEFIVNNFFDDEAGGDWGLGLPTKDFSPKGPVPERAFVHLIRKPAARDWFSWNDPALAIRYAWRMLDTDFTISGFYGWQDFPVSRLKSAELHLGPNGRAPLSLNPPPFNQPVPPEVGDLALRLVNAGLVDLNTCTAEPSLGLPLPPLGSPGIPGGCSAVANIQLDFRERKKLIGLTATRELNFLRFPPKGVSPVFRLETSYEFEKPFNTVRVTGPDKIAVVRRDFWSTLVGFDYLLWLPDAFYGNWLLTQQRAFFTSAQLFWFKVLGNGAGDRQVLWQSPYIDWKRETNEFWATFLWTQEVYKDLVGLEGLAVINLDPGSFGYRQRITFRNFGDHFRPRIEWIHMEGKGDQVFGAFDRNDSIELELVYQF